jgi:glucosyl-3-phosphoglycerate synthase
MADFQQAGDITTLHRLAPENLEALEHEIARMARRYPIALVLPCLFSEFSRPAIRHIIEELRHVTYIDHVVLSLGQASADDLAVANRALARLPQRVSVIWNDGPAMQRLYGRLRDSDLDAGPDGKGRSCWIAYGFLLADEACEVVACHDCDVTTYSRELLARLCYPVVNRRLGFEFAKGYYARVATAMNGRVTRLFVNPLLRALLQTLGRVPLLEYLSAFRYPLAGEFAMTREVARVSRIPANWGLEVGVLAEVFRNFGARRACQTELCATYDHKHQALSADDPGKGLVRMCVEIGQSLLRSLAAEGVVLSDAFFRTLTVQYLRLAQDAVSRYEADAAINRLSFDRHLEERTLEAFAHGLALACRRHSSDPLGVPMIPSWERVSAAIPGFLEMLRDAVSLEPAASAAA